MIDIATGCTANLSSEAAKGFFLEAKRHVKYAIIYKETVKKFEEKLEMLKAKRTSVQQDVEVAERNGEKMKADVQLWSNTVDKVITEEEKKVKDLEDKAKNKCFFGLCPNIKSRYQLSSKAEEDAAAFDELIRQCQFNRVGYRDVPEVIAHKDFQSFKSREKVFNDIMESLKDATMSMIGVYGMPGVGKTSLVKEVARQVQQVKLFDSIIIVIVSHTPDIQKIQDQIAESLGLNLEEKSPVVRARRLCERLMKEKKALIVLDDIWKKLDLDEVGIPIGSRHKGCKILLTSRNQSVLCNQMDATKTFPIVELDDIEAWEFFKKMAGDSVESAELRPIATEVAKRCARLPLALATVARALRNKSSFAWRDALRQLQRPSPENFTEISVSVDVYSAIQLSYNHLQSEELKQTFLLCSLLRRVASIDDLLRYAIGLGLINGVTTLEEARDRLLTMVSNLKASCLLLDSNTNEWYFDVHDLTYIVAISIASKDDQVFALNGEDDRTDWPDGETMKKYKKICLQYSSISKLPDELNCPQLFLFLMFSKDFSLTMPTNFFKEATNLKVLVLTNMHFSPLPSSIRLLTSLCTLCLNKCKLGDIAIIGELKNLEILGLSESDITILPKEIGQLIKLKLLDLSHCYVLKIISAGVLSSLSRLEELYMGESFIEWEVGRLANQRSNASLAELKTLSRLSTLEVHIPDAKAAPGDLFFEVSQKLKRYKIFIGTEWEWFRYYENSKILKLRLSTSIDDLDRGIRILLKKTEDLFLDELKGVKIALQELNDGKSLLKLKKLHIQNGLDIEYIINDNDAADKNGFLELKSLTLEGLPQLISFCPEHKTGATSMPQHELPLFSRKMLFPCLENLRLSSINVSRIWHNQFCTHEKLTTLIIQDCGNLKHLLSFSMARCLLHLKYFEIVRCKCLREIIFSEDIEEEIQAMTPFPQLNSLEEAAMDTILFPKIHRITLMSCSKLKRFCLGSVTLQFPSLVEIEVYNCPKMYAMASTIIPGEQEDIETVGGENTPFFNDKVLCANLKHLKLWSTNIQKIWHDKIAVDSFSELNFLLVRASERLLNVFPFNMVEILEKLETLYIWECESLEEIIGPADHSLNSNESHAVTATELVEARSTTKFVFPKLRLLSLYMLPKLKGFYSKMHTTEWPSLKELFVIKCNKVETFAGEYLNFRETQGETQPVISVQQPLFWVSEDTFPNLELLVLWQNGIKKQIRQGALLKQYFCNLRKFRAHQLS